MKQIIVADKNNNLIQFNFFDIDKMKKFKKIYENNEFTSIFDTALYKEKNKDIKISININ